MSSGLTPTQQDALNRLLKEGSIVSGTGVSMATARVLVREVLAEWAKGPGPAWEIVSPVEWRRRQSTVDR